MSAERDERPLAEIAFDCSEMRELFAICGVVVAQDIIDLGCTGLVQHLRTLPVYPDRLLSIVGRDRSAPHWLSLAMLTQGRMSGSICGLPCYVPKDRFCLVHNTIGGLQTTGNVDGPQATHHPEALPLMSRELTPEEQQQVGGIKAKLNADAKAVALQEYGAEDVFEEEPDADDATPAPALSCPIPQPPFKCLDHVEPDWACRECIAQAIVESHADMRTTVRVYVANCDITSRCASVQAVLDEALVELNAGNGMPVELWVRVASWSKKVTRD